LISSHLSIQISLDERQATCYHSLRRADKAFPMLNRSAAREWGGPMEQKTNSNRLTFVLVLLGLAVGVPAASGVAFREWAFQHPLLAAGLVVAYELVLLLAGLARDVWAKLRPSLVDWLTLRLDLRYWRYYRKYRQYLLNRDRYLNSSRAGLRGPLALDVEEVFVELSMTYRAPGSISANPTPKIAGLVLPAHPTFSGKFSEGREPVWKYLQEKRHRVILGAPGTGKSTLLQHITLTLLDRKKRRAVGISAKLPILLPLRSHWEAIVDNPTPSLAELVNKHLTKMKLEPPQGWFEHQLRQGRCLVMLDGLDEVADPLVREKVVVWVKDQLALYGQSPFLLTSRRYGYPKDHFNEMDVLEVRPFSGEQITRFISNWYLVNTVRVTGKHDKSTHLLAVGGCPGLAAQTGRDTRFVGTSGESAAADNDFQYSFC
jgi:energy-coupling factor transporter ATP-binding protein EcfA2